MSQSFEAPQEIYAHPFKDRESSGRPRFETTLYLWTSVIGFDLADQLFRMCWRFICLSSKVLLFFGATDIHGAPLRHRHAEDCVRQGVLLIALEVAMTQVAWSYTSPGKSKLDLRFFSLILCLFSPLEPQASLIRRFTVLGGLVRLNNFHRTPVMFWKWHSASQMPGSLQRGY